MPILKTRVEDTGTFGDGVWRGVHTDLWNYGLSYSEGWALVKFEGTWTEESVVSEDFADEYYLGGMTHVISQEKADELTLAGFGVYITPGGDEGFGQGGFGLGTFGE